MLGFLFLLFFIGLSHILWPKFWWDLNRSFLGFHDLQPKEDVDESKFVKKMQLAGYIVAIPVFLMILFIAYLIVSEIGK